MPVKPPPPPPPPSSPGQHAISSQQSIRSSQTNKSYGSAKTAESGRGEDATTPQKHSPPMINSQHQKQNCSTSRNSAITSQQPPTSTVNNNQLRPNSNTGNGSPNPASRTSPHLVATGNGGKGDASPSRVRQSTPSPKAERFSNINVGDRKQPPSPMSSSNEANPRMQGVNSSKQQSSNTATVPNYQSKTGIIGTNNASIDQQQPTIKRPRKGSGGIHSKQQQQLPPQPTSHLVSNQTDNVSKETLQTIV